MPEREFRASRRAGSAEPLARFGRARTLARGDLALLALGAVLLIHATAFLGTALAQWDNTFRQSYTVFLLAAVLIGAVAAYRAPTGTFQAKSDKLIFCAAVALPCYVAFQCIPLPAAALRILSPARAELLSALAPVMAANGWAPLSVAIGQTSIHFSLVAAYMLVFFASWLCGLQAPERPWLAIAPVMGAAVIQSLIGLWQVLENANPTARGSYGVRNHFAGLLELAFPFAVAYAASAVARSRRSRHVTLDSTIAICAGSGAGLLIFLAAVASLSRMVPLACFASLLVMGTLVARGKGRALMMSGAVVAAAGLLLAFLLPTELIYRYSSELAAGRSPVWRDTRSLIRAYPLVGCGLGGYESSFTKYKTWGFLFDQDYAHNDYLQFLAELGIAGFFIGAAFGILILVRLLRVAHTAHNPDRQWKALACVGSLTAILIHSTGDFNLYVPANATVLAWICGVSAAQAGNRKTAGGSANT